MLFTFPAKTLLAVIDKNLGKPEEAVRQKIRRLGLEVVEQKKIICSTTSQKLPAELPSVEEMLKKLSLFIALAVGLLIACLLVSYMLLTGVLIYSRNK